RRLPEARRTRASLTPTRLARPSHPDRLDRDTPATIPTRRIAASRLRASIAHTFPTGRQRYTGRPTSAGSRLRASTLHTFPIRTATRLAQIAMEPPRCAHDLRAYAEPRSHHTARAAHSARDPGDRRDDHRAPRRQRARPVRHTRSTRCAGGSHRTDTRARHRPRIRHTEAGRHDQHDTNPGR